MKSLLNLPANRAITNASLESYENNATVFKTEHKTEQSSLKEG